MVAATARALAPLVAAAAAGRLARPTAGPRRRGDPAPSPTALADPPGDARSWPARPTRPAPTSGRCSPDLGDARRRGDGAPARTSSTVLAGGLAEPGGRIEAAVPARPARAHASWLRRRRRVAASRCGAARRACAAASTTAAAPSPPRRRRSPRSCGRRVEVVEIGQSGAARASRPRRTPARPGARSRWASSPDAALLPRGFGDAHLDAIIGWLTHPARPAPRARPPARARARAVGRRRRRRRAAAAGGRPRRRSAGSLAATPAIDALPAAGRRGRRGRRLERRPGAGGRAGRSRTSSAGPACGRSACDHARLLAPLGTIAGPRRAARDHRRPARRPPRAARQRRDAGRAARRAAPAGTLSVRGRPGETRSWTSCPAASSSWTCRRASVAIVELRFRDAVDLGLAGAARGGGGRRRARRACSWTCATSRCGCPTGSERRRDAARGVAGGPVGGDATRDAPRPLAGAEIPSRPLARARPRGAVRAAAGRPAARGAGRRRRRAGDPLLEHLRDRRIDEVAIPGAGAERRRSAGRAAGRRAPGRPPPATTTADGELLAPVPGQRDRWRLVDGRPPRHAGVAGRRRGRRGPARRARSACGPPGRRCAARSRPASAARGRLELATDPFGDLRPGGIDVGRAGSILVVGRADRRRGADAGPGDGRPRDRRRVAAGQGAARLPGLGAPPARRAPPVAAVRRPRPRRDASAARSPAPVTALLERHRRAARSRCSSTRRRSCSTRADDELPAIDADWVRVRSGAHAGARGPAGRRSAGLRRFARRRPARGGAASRSTDEPPVDVPIGDLERFA